MNWSEVRELHERAAGAAVAAAQRIPPERWAVPIAEGKWTPAEIVEHLTLTYDVFLKQLRGDGGMKIRTAMWMRLVLRAFMMPGILRGKGFPKGARAPREVRPS